MPITKEMLEARRKFLMDQLQKLNSDRDATFGALQDCDFWLAQLNQPTEEQQ